jgi:hypothetical protein
MNKMLKYDYILIYLLFVVCGNCSSMTTPEECICCVEVPAVHSQMLSEDMKGFTIQLGRKGTDMEQMSMREHPISELTG